MKLKINDGEPHNEQHRLHGKNKGASYEIEINDGGLIMNNIAFTEKTMGPHKKIIEGKKGKKRTRRSR